jgi:hypothetical protein
LGLAESEFRRLEAPATSVYSNDAAKNSELTVPALRTASEITRFGNSGRSGTERPTLREPFDSENWSLRIVDSATMIVIAAGVPILSLAEQADDFGRLAQLVRARR